MRFRGFNDKYISHASDAFLARNVALGLSWDQLEKRDDEPSQPSESALESSLNLQH
jgi:hypothetical protein